MEITKQIEIDYGHLVHFHNSACKNLHGHRGKIIAHLEGDLITGNVSESGMVMDFKYIKEIMMYRIHQILDHAFIISKDAPQLKYFELINKECYNNDMRLVVLDVIPTAENLAKWCYDEIYTDIADTYNTGLTLTAIEFWETPTSCAVYRGPKQFKKDQILI